jgi:hypothetical protein
MNAQNADVRTESRRSWLSWSCGAELTERDRKNLRSFNFWLLAWCFTMAFSLVLLSKDGLIEGPAIRWAMALVPDVLGVFAVATYVRFIRHADELVRKIHLEAIALGFGAGLVFVMGYTLAELAGAPELETAWLASVMLFAAGIGQLMGTRRYR